MTKQRSHTKANGVIKVPLTTLQVGALIEAQRAIERANGLMHIEISGILKAANLEGDYEVVGFKDGQPSHLELRKVVKTS